MSQLISAAARRLETRLADQSNTGLGDAMMGVNNGDANEVSRTLHFWVKARRRNLCSFLLPAEVDDVLSGAGTINLATKWANAYAACGAAGGGKGAFLDLPQGVIRIGAASAVCAANKVWVEGQGRATRVESSSVAADIFLVGDGVGELSGAQFSNFDIWAQVVKTAGYAFNCRMVTDSKWENVRLGSIDDYVANANVHRLWDGVYFDRFSQNSMDGGEICVAGSPVRARGNADQSFGAELNFDGGLRVVYAGQVAFLFGGGTGGVYLGRVDVSNCAGGVRWDKTLTAITNREAFIDDLCTLDNNSGPAIDIAADGLETLDAKGWISACGSAAGALPSVRVLSGTAVNASGLRVQSSPYDGVVVDGGAWTQSGGIIRSNGSGVNGGHGLRFVSGRLTLNDAIIHSNGNGTRGQGVSIDPAADNYSIKDNDLFGNGQGAITAGANVGSTRRISGNRGYATENSGTAQILNGNGSVVVNHGLADPPTSIIIWWAGTPEGTAEISAPPGSFTATQFTVNLSVAATANRDIGWRAVRGAM